MRTAIWLFLCIVIQSCIRIEKIEHNVIQQEVDSFIIEESTSSVIVEESTSSVIVEEVKPIVVETTDNSISLIVYEDVIDESVYKEIEEKIQLICDSLNGKLEESFNYSPEINKILVFNKVPLRSAYCGATINYILKTAGVPYNVKNPEWASNNFIDKSQIVYQKGKWVTSDRTMRKGYVTGYNFNSNRINHVGVYINETSTHFKAFEGNTNDPLGKNPQGFYYKNRNKNITYVRKWTL